VGRDERRARVPRGRQPPVEAVGERDVRAEADGDGVGGEVGVGVVDSQLGAGHHEQPVPLACPLGLAVDLRDVLAEPFGRDAEPRPWVVGRVHMVGDAEDVELMPAVEVDSARFCMSCTSHRLARGLASKR
jgi:hypothetical protein